MAAIFYDYALESTMQDKNKLAHPTQVRGSSEESQSLLHIASGEQSSVSPIEGRMEKELMSFSCDRKLGTVIFSVILF